MIIIIQRSPRNFGCDCDEHGSLTRGQTTPAYAWERARSHRDEAWCFEPIFEIHADGRGYVVIGDDGPIGPKAYRDRASAMRAVRKDEAARRAG